MRRSIPLLATVLVLVGCASGAGQENEAEPVPTEEAPASTTPATTPDDVKLAIYERALSECASQGIDRLASKYKVANPTRESVAAAVGAAWTDFFRAGPDAVEQGKDGCLLGFSRP